MKMSEFFGKLVFVYALIELLCVGCEGKAFQFSPDGTEFVKRINNSFYISCLNPNATNVWWFRNDERISNDFTRVHVERKEEKFTAEAGLFFSTIQSSDAGIYTCSGTVDNKTESASFLLRTYKPITFRDTPTVQSFWEWDTGVIKCEAEGEPEPHLSWFINGKHADTFKGYKQLGDGLLIQNVSLADENQEFLCRAAAVSNITSNIAVAKIKVNVMHAPKLAGNKSEIDVYGYVGGAVNLTCQVDANPPANFTWLRNDTIFKGDENVVIVPDENKSTLFISYVNNTWFERYLCTAVNERGAVNVGFNLEKLAKPEPPKKAKIHSATHNSLQLEIHPPPSKAQDILGYRVQIMKKQEREKGQDWEMAREVFLHKDKPYVVKDLEPGTEYLVRVTSQNKAGAGEYTNEMKTKTLHKSAASSPSLSTSLVLLVVFLYSFYFNRS